MSNQKSVPRATGERSPQTITSLAVGSVLAAVGLLGFVLVPDEGLLLGIFGVNTIHNAVHLATGLLGIGASAYAGSRYATAYNVSHSVLYLLVFLLGIGTTVVLSLLNANTADNLLHFALAAVLGLVGVAVRE